MPELTRVSQAEVLTVLSQRAFRRAIRVECTPTSRVRFVIRPDFCQQAAGVHDISTDGIGLLLNRSLEKGTRLALQLGIGYQPTCRVVPAQVVHCTRWDEDWWLVGCQLSKPLTPEELDALLG